MATTTKRADAWTDKTRQVFPSQKDRKAPEGVFGDSGQFRTVLKKFTKTKKGN